MSISPHGRHVWGERAGDMAAASRDIEHPPVRLRLGEAIGQSGLLRILFRLAGEDVAACGRLCRTSAHSGYRLRVPSAGAIVSYACTVDAIYRGPQPGRPYRGVPISHRSFWCLALAWRLVLASDRRPAARRRRSVHPTLTGLSAGALSAAPGSICDPHRRHRQRVPVEGQRSTVGLRLPFIISASPKRRPGNRRCSIAPCRLDGRKRKATLWRRQGRSLPSSVIARTPGVGHPARIAPQVDPHVCVHWRSRPSTSPIALTGGRERVAQVISAPELLQSGFDRLWGTAHGRRVAPRTQAI